MNKTRLLLGFRGIDFSSRRVYFKMGVSRISSMNGAYAQHSQAHFCNFILSDIMKEYLIGKYDIVNQC